MDSNYEEIFNYVKNCLSGNDIEATSIERFPFRKRSEHTWRVFTWAKCLLEQEELPSSTNKEAVLTSAIFHDVGYALKTETESGHAKDSVIVFNEYASSRNYSTGQQEFIAYLIQNHSNKDFMKLPDTPIELILLMEADLLDEAGALSIVWDCLSVGSEEDPGYLETYHHVREFSGELLNENPMVTKAAREFWAGKQNLIREFIDQLGRDLDIEN